jgi:hypothetical protein
VASFREALGKIGEPGQDGLFPAFRSGFSDAPASLREAMRAMEDPLPASWSLPEEENIDEDWTQNCQGVAVGGGFWFMPSNGSWFGVGDVTPRAIFKFHGSELVGTFEVPDSDASHLGDLEYVDGELFAALEGSPHSPHGPAVLMVDESFTFSQIQPLLGESGGVPPHTDMPWCAIHPWNGLLYSSSFDNVTTVRAYEPADDGFRHVPSRDIPLSKALERVQGGAFSPRGHLYLSSDTYVSGKYKGVHVFSILNGAYRGWIRVLADEDTQELEGLCFSPMSISGHHVDLHVVLLDTIDLEKDDIFFKHYAAPDPSRT